MQSMLYAIVCIICYAQIFGIAQHATARDGTSNNPDWGVCLDQKSSQILTHTHYNMTHM